MFFCSVSHSSVPSSICYFLSRELTLAIIFFNHRFNDGNSLGGYSFFRVSGFLHLSREVDLLVIKFWIVSHFISTFRKCAKEACLLH